MRIGQQDPIVLGGDDELWLAAAGGVGVLLAGMAMRKKSKLSNPTSSSMPLTPDPSRLPSRVPQERLAAAKRFAQGFTDAIDLRYELPRETGEDYLAGWRKGWKMLSGSEWR